MIDGSVHSSYSCLNFLVGEWASRYAYSPDCTAVLFELFCLLGGIFIKVLRWAEFVVVLMVPLCYFASREVFDVWKCIIFVAVFFVYLC